MMGLSVLFVSMVKDVRSLFHGRSHMLHYLLIIIFYEEASWTTQAHNPEILDQYDAVICEQIRRGIVEPV